MATEEDENTEEFQDLGLLEVDVVYYSLSASNKGDPSKSKRGKAYKGRNDSEYKCFEAHDGVRYRPGDHVFMEISASEPYFIGTISNFKMAKRDQLMVKVVRFYRPEDVPEDSYSLLLQDRKEDTSLNHEVLNALQCREIFSSDISYAYSICTLRGKCSVRSIKDVRALSPCDVLELRDTFYSLVSFDPNNSRLASVQGEIRVGPSYQAVDSPLNHCSAVDEPDRDELLYRPGYIEEDEEKVFVNTVRTLRMFAMARSENITELERDYRTGDLCLHDAIITLHQCGYNVKRAMEAMDRIDDKILKETRFLTAGDAKKFAKGIKMYGKNFLKIKNELLPKHERADLVQFYYRWKKTSDATRPKPLTRQRNSTACTYRKTKNNQPKISHPNTDLADYDSASETEMERLINDGHATTYACHHCYSSKSKDWHHSGKDRQLLCTDCRLFFKKYGQHRQVDRPSTVPPSLHKSKNLDSQREEEQGVRTRAGKKERRRTPSDTDRKNNSPASSGDGEVKQRVGKRKRNHQQTPEHINGSLKRRAIKEERDSVFEDVKAEEKSNQENLIKDQDQDMSSEKHVKMEVDQSSENTSTTEAGSVNSALAEVTPSTSVCSEMPTTSSRIDQLAQVTDKTEKPLLTMNDSPKPVAKVASPPSVQEELPGTSVNHAEEVEKVKEEEVEDNRWTVGNKVVLTCQNSQFVRAIERSSEITCARSDLIYQHKPGVHKNKSRESIATPVKKNNIIGEKMSHKKSMESQATAPANVSVPTSVQLSAIQGNSGVDAFMGGRVPVNGTAVNGIPGIFPGMPDPRFAFLNSQQHYALAYEQAAMQKQIEQHVRAQFGAQFELIRNGANGQVPSNPMRESPSRNMANPHNLPPGLINPQFHNYNGMDPRALATILHNPQLASQFGVGIDNGHAAAAMFSAMEQRAAAEQRMLAGVGGMELLGQGGMQASNQAPPSHLHPHAMMHHAVAAQQSNGDALQLQQLLAMSAAAQTPRPYVDQQILQHMSMMNPFGQDMTARLVNPGALNSDMMRRLQQEGGFTNPNQRP